MPTSSIALRGYVGKSIADICDTSFTSPAQNHCAHFVSHALGLKSGTLCGDMHPETRHTGATIRCDEIFNRLARRGPWAQRPSLDDGLLIFVLSSRNVVGNRMLNVPQKHVGIYFGGQVFNFSNAQHKVVMDASVDAFHRKFIHAYAGNDIALYFGVAP